MGGGVRRQRVEREGEWDWGRGGSGLGAVRAAEVRVKKFKESRWRKG